MKNKKISGIILSIVIIMSSFIGYMSLYPSKENKDDKNRLNVENQMNYIKDIAKEPHSIFDYEEHENVKNYLIEELKNLGVDSSIYSYDDVYVERSKTKEDLQNIYAESDGSTGAADAGYGLSTILETIKTIKENNIGLNNGIKILITDGEEYGLLGAKEAVKEKDI